MVGRCILYRIWCTNTCKTKTTGHSVKSEVSTVLSLPKCLAIGNLHSWFPYSIRVRDMVLSTTFDNISTISWRSVLLVKATGVPGETIDLPQGTDKLYHLMLYRIPLIMIGIRTHSIIYAYNIQIMCVLVLCHLSKEYVFLYMCIFVHCCPL